MDDVLQVSIEDLVVINPGTVRSSLPSACVVNLVNDTDVYFISSSYF